MSKFFKNSNCKVLLCIILTMLLFTVFSVNLMIYANAEKVNSASCDVYSEFTEDSVLVVLDSEISRINKQHYANFFDGLKIKSIKDLTKRNQNKKSENNDFRQILQIFLENPSRDNVIEVVQKLRDLDGVYNAEPNYINGMNLVPNDPNFTNGTLWGLNGSYGINAIDAWDDTTGSDTSGCNRYGLKKTSVLSGVSFLCP